MLALLLGIEVVVHMTFQKSTGCNFYSFRLNLTSAISTLEIAYFVPFATKLPNWACQSVIKEQTQIYGHEFIMAKTRYSIRIQTQSHCHIFLHMWLNPSEMIQMVKGSNST